MKKKGRKDLIDENEIPMPAESDSEEEMEEEPEIIGTIPNMTVAVGREARIPCKVHNLGSYRVSVE